ncbi:protein trichome berefringence-like 7 [Cucumis melo var. makuwa]|uniref:Protein trichome berefringence-like 7 n=1 Tax=Cucumis melo var. makuwa TaxID=1194695 RepID=A0A5D3BZA9_CUCMM|nr:protein trichome berefringence-like 7 [Cucumis melo var. makuwa]
MVVHNNFNHNQTSYSNLQSLKNGKQKTILHSCLNQVWIFPCLFTLLIAIACIYTLIFPNIHRILQIYNFTTTSETLEASPSAKFTDCDVFDGRWVEDDSRYPIYNSTDCPFAERGFSCFENGRKDKEYLRWQWKPKKCEIPRFDAEKALEMLRGKRVVFVGDSLSRTQWESWICMLMEGVKKKESVYEINGSQITKTIRHLGVKFMDHNITVDFYRSVFLMNKTYNVPAGAPKNVRMTVRLDLVDDISDQWIDSDLLVFNTGGWWTQNRLFNEICFFQIGNSLEFGISVIDGYKMALNTWADWAEANINPNRTTVFFRTIESTHWRGPNQCDVSEKPLNETKGKEKSEKSDIIMEVLEKKMKRVPVKIMHLTPMGSYRSDAHVGNWGDNPSLQDCGHWCLPGFPDIWNEIIISYFLPKISSFTSYQN